jgi:hypothetical protein
MRLKFFSTNLCEKINELDKDYEETTCLNSCMLKKPFELPAEVTEDTSVRYFTAPYMSSLHKKFEFLKIFNFDMDHRGIKISVFKEKNLTF